MNSLTHRLVALEVRRRLKSEMGIILPKKYLVWGSVRPDFCKHPVSHFKDESVELFYEKWDRLSAMDVDNQLKEFCTELGEIFHFLCDYFCYAHNSSFLSKEMWSHLKYENKLHKFAKRRHVEVFKTSFADYSMVPFRDLIEYKHKMFIQKRPSFEHDLSSSFEICMIVAKKLFRESTVTLTYQIA